MICIFKRYQFYSDKGNHALVLPMKVKFESVRINQRLRKMLFNVRNKIRRVKYGDKKYVFVSSKNVP